MLTALTGRQVVSLLTHIIAIPVSIIIPVIVAGPA